MQTATRAALGLCLGASSIGLAHVALSGGRILILRGESRSHGGDPSGTLLTLLDTVPGWRNLPVAVTGRKLRGLVTLPSISEPEAVELAAAHVLEGRSGGATVLCAGGETFMAYGLDGQGRVRDIRAGNKCASGTGEFLLQQLGRMGLGVPDLEGLDHQAAPHRVSGRCSVFCKSDCTHALNKGAPKASVVAGLGRMMAGKCLELIESLPRERVLLTGGCCANPYLVRFLREAVDGLLLFESSSWFEALGSGLWALDHQPVPLGEGVLFTPRPPCFTLLPALSGYLDLVEFKEHPRGRAQPGDEVLVGLDVGSTTTKGVVVRRRDRAVLAGEYLRTEGDPVAASRRVYLSLAGQLASPVRITGLGVTGSGRAIAALHGGATAAINEIVAHAAAAAHYDPLVDTIFEIGGQDAKYTFLSGGHPCDSAMNEACSAGTGSFLEESAREALGVDTLDIGDKALEARSTPDFNDQCAAFIGSDVKAAVQEGLPLPDILAGLVHSVALNYSNRVKGSRPVGDRIFMQGGVCYNRAVPAAMAMLTGKRIVVPPEPGLMGALGVALEVDNRLSRGVLSEGRFDLDHLAVREATYRAPFTCRGGRGGQKGCDRGCSIARIEVGGKVHPFGGVCNRFENLRLGRPADASDLDIVQARQRRVFRDHAAPVERSNADASGSPDAFRSMADRPNRPDGPKREAPGGESRPTRPTVGLSRSYLVNTYYPLFAGFFRELGFEPVLPDRCDPEGVKRRGSALCYPAELAHGFLADLLGKRPDALFLPHLRGVPASFGQEVSCTCVLLQGEPFYLRGAFPELAAYGPRLLSPTLDFTRGLAAAEGAFLRTARGLGADGRAGLRAFRAGLEAQLDCGRDLAELGREALERVAESPLGLGVVLLGRAYNAFASEANKAVPEKLATRGAMVIPCDLLPLSGNGRGASSMYWGQGRTILAAGRQAAARDDLFGVYVTNFSCGPDSFLLGYFREEMGDKPSLTLELDSHVADAGLETRLEAFLDIADNHRRLRSGRGAGATRNPSPRRFRPAAMETVRGSAGIRLGSGEWLPLTHERVRLTLPSMNPYGTSLSAAALNGAGVRTVALPPADAQSLKLGRGNSSCKECLPLQLTVGTLLDYLGKRPEGEATAYFMPGAGGPCRFGQYAEFTSRLIAGQAIPDAAVLSASADNGYAGLPPAVTLGIWRGTVAGDFYEEMRAALLAGAADPGEALALLSASFERAQAAMRKPWRAALAEFRREASELARIPMRTRREDLPVVALVGEIFVRHDPISRRGLVERLADRGIMARTAPVSEWVFYTDWLQNQGVTNRPGIGGRIRQWFKRRSFEQLRRALLPSGLIDPAAPHVSEVVRAGERFVSPELTGEAILTVGAAFHEILAPACGVVSIGPFGCMPARLAEAVLTPGFDTEALAAIHPGRSLPPGVRGGLPFLPVETDGNPYPQLIEARLEAFCLRALRLHEAMRGARTSG